LLQINQLAATGPLLLRRGFGFRGVFSRL
jgi:hypothetical protein